MRCIDSEMHRQTKTEGQGSVYGVDLEDIEVSLIMLSKGVPASSDAVEEQHAIAEDVSSVSLPGIAPTTCYELLWCLPPAAATCALPPHSTGLTQPSSLNLAHSHVQVTLILFSDTQWLAKPLGEI